MFNPYGELQWRSGEDLDNNRIYFFNYLYKITMIFRKLLLCMCLLSSMVCYCQSSRIDSKKQAWERLSSNISDSNRQDLYNHLGRIYFIESWGNKKIIDSAFYYLRKGAYLGDSTNLYNKEITNVSLCLLGQTYIYAGDTFTGKKICMQVIRRYQRYNQKMDEADTWRMMAKELWVRNVDDKFIPAYFDSSINLYDQANHAVKVAEMRIEKMNYFSEKGNRIAAEAELREILKEAKEDDCENLSAIYQMLASQERYKGNLNKALEYALEAVKYVDRSDDKYIAQYCYGELAQVYEELGEAEKSIYWYKRCIDERKNKVTQYIMYRTISLMVVQMIKAKEEKEALKLLQQIVRDDPPKGHAESAVLSQSFAYCYIAMKQFKLAEEKYLEMIADYEEGEFHTEILHIAYYDIGKFYVDMQQYDKAGTYLNKALVIGNSTTGRTRDLHLLLFKVDSATGQLTSAIKHFQTYKSLNDSIFSQAKSRQIEELMIKYETEKKDQNITLLENESNLQKRKIMQANQTRNWIIGVAVLFLTIIGLLINNSRLKQQINRKLKAQQKEIEKKNSSLQHLVEEKDWLVKEIHHRVKNNFHIVMGLLGTQSEYLKTEEAIQSMTESQHRVHAMSLIHQKLYQSDNLSAINMTDYIYELVNYLRDSFNIRKSIQFKLQIDPIDLDLSHCVPVGLIMNEAITNAIKYAFPGSLEGEIEISFRRISGAHLLLIIRDNGIGLPSHFDMDNPSSMGMRLMKGLSDDIEGKFEINNHNGTEIMLNFKYNPEKINGITQLTTNITG